MKDFIYILSKNIQKCFSRNYLFFHLLAIVLTYIIVMSGFDWWYFNVTRIHLLQNILFPAVIIGLVLPVILPVIFYIVGRAQKSERSIHTAYALFQTEIISYVISIFYKAITGRIPPLFIDSAIDISRKFNFGFLRNGIFWGWPSSHTTVAFAMAVTLITLYPRNKILKYGALLYALYVGLGVSISIHWFSEFIAGIIFGSIAGVVVGRYFKSKTKGA